MRFFKAPMHVEYPPRLSISDFVKRVKGRSSRLLQSEFPELKITILRKAFLSDRVWCLDNRECNGRNGSRILGASPSPNQV